MQNEQQDQSKPELVIVELTSTTPSETKLNPGPASRPSNSKAALRRCIAAWKRVLDEHMEDTAKDPIDRRLANRYASPAYCDAMPSLDGRDGIRDFIACTAHGILIGAIPAEHAGQLLYAAQVALNALPREPNPPSA
jgi:hypothetical protein